MVGGKAYPFQNLNITEIVLKAIRKLAKNNLNWTYKYGIEPYRDMKYIKSIYAMDRAASYAKYAPRKKNILFASNGMYNDMIADHCSKFLCYRNKVKKTKIINYSGKATCLCCGKSIIEENDDIFNEDYYEYDERPGYNDRYLNIDSHVCLDCQSKFFSCERCNCEPTNYSLIVPLKTLTYKDSDTRQMVTKKVCTYCASSINRCPDCGELFETFWNTKEDQTFFAKRINAKKIDPPFSSHDFIISDDYARIICCQDCMDKLLNSGDFFEAINNHPLNNNNVGLYTNRSNVTIYVTKKEYDFDDPAISKYFLKNVTKQH
jgi:hypothetical protein